MFYQEHKRWKRTLTFAVVGGGQVGKFPQQPTFLSVPAKAGKRTTGNSERALKAAPPGLHPSNTYCYSTCSLAEDDTLLIIKTHC